MADAAWKKHNEKIKAKRTKTTKKDPAKNHRQGDRLTVQRLSAEVAGKAQKYTRIGPREFVMMVNKIDRPNTRLLRFVTFVHLPFIFLSFELFVASFLFMKGISYCVTRRKLEPLDRATANFKRS